MIDRTIKNIKKIFCYFGGCIRKTILCKVFEGILKAKIANTKNKFFCLSYI